MVCRQDDNKSKHDLLFLFNEFYMNTFASLSLQNYTPVVPNRGASCIILYSLKEGGVDEEGIKVLDYLSQIITTQCPIKVS